ncbi:unnamed protein product, partial [marine sediment metagenome]
CKGELKIAKLCRVCKGNELKIRRLRKVKVEDHG